MNSLRRNAQLSLGVFKSKHLLYVFDKPFLLSPHFSIKSCVLFTLVPCHLDSTQSMVVCVK